MTCYLYWLRGTLIGLKGMGGLAERELGLLWVQAMELEQPSEVHQVHTVQVHMLWHS